MVEFEYQPWEKVIVHEVIKWPIEQFLQTRSIGVTEGGIARPLTWADGFVFDRHVMPPTPEAIKETLEGRVHWLSLTYAVLEEYQEGFELPRQIKMQVVDQSYTSIYREMAQWLRENFEKD